MKRCLLPIALLLSLFLNLALATHLSRGQQTIPTFDVGTGGAISPVTTSDIGTGGAVATVDAYATQVGIEVLQQGGNAMDAAIATAAALGVVRPLSCGIGGGGFLVFYQRDQDRVITLDSRETAPAAATPNLFRNPNDPNGAPLPFYPNRISSGLAVGVPGTPLLWDEALRRYGTWSLNQALQPAITLAADGFPMSEILHRQISSNQSRFAAFTSTRELFLPNGNPPPVGSLWRVPDLAKTYRLVAEQGVNSFYRGEIARAIVETVQAPPAIVNPPFPILPGQMTLDDLDRYELRLRPAVETTYRGHRLFGMGLPSSGGITIAQALHMLEGYDLSRMDSADVLHYLIEAERLAYADRNAYLGDPEFVDVLLPGLLSGDYAEQRRQNIPEQASTAIALPGNPLPFQNDPSPSRTEPVVTAYTPGLTGDSTTHLTVADGGGNVVSYTFTIEMTGGSGIVVPGYGFLLNNELTDFDAESPHPNTPEAGKRPRSSMAPTLVFAPDGSILALGSPGGSTIITTVLQVLVNRLDLGMDLENAIAAPRFSQRNEGRTTAEAAFLTTETATALKAMGHTFESRDQLGAVTAILIQADGTLEAVAEPARSTGGAAKTVTSGS
jgi:gamma-glutamyltranspeptidase/glutathione hydrolase